MENSENGATADAPASPSPKRGFWRRLFLWGLQGGGVLFGVLGVFLIGIALPDLRREVAPPEISGPERVALSPDSSKNTFSPTTGTLSVSGDASGTSGSLNLDDFPHLSPKMRELAQAWLDQCEETSQALDTITDPALRAQAVEYLKKRKIREFLNLPLEWGTCPYKEALRHVKDNRFDRFYGLIVDSANLLRFREQCPVFYKAYTKEVYCFMNASIRFSFEFSMFSEHWGNTTRLCVFPKMMLLVPDSPIQEDENLLWEEEVYSWRQMGVKGTVGLTARSYQRALMKVAKDRRSPLIRKLYAAGGAVAFAMTGEPEEEESPGTKPD